MVTKEEILPAGAGNGRTATTSAGEAGVTYYTFQALSDNIQAGSSFS